MTRDHLQSPPRTIVPSLSIGDPDSLLSNMLLPDERAFLTAAMLSRTHEAHGSSGRTHCSTRSAFTPWRRWPHAAVFWMHETTAALQQTNAAKAISKEMDAIRAMVDELSRSFDNLDRVSASARSRLVVSVRFTSRVLSRACRSSRCLQLVACCLRRSHRRVSLPLWLAAVSFASLSSEVEQSAVRRCGRTRCRFHTPTLSRSRCACSCSRCPRHWSESLLVPSPVPVDGRPGSNRIGQHC